MTEVKYVKPYVFYVAHRRTFLQRFWAQPLREPSALDEPRSFRLLFYAGSALGQGRHFAGIDDICGEA